VQDSEDVFAALVQELAVEDRLAPLCRLGVEGHQSIRRLTKVHLLSGVWCGVGQVRNKLPGFGHGN
jgi:hypothetical protein